ncbi:hypothetical protein [Paraglaciecola sp. 25GB23A]|uniref:hypothetical protein n=1 Tax=Paraglaciecola sp. 25GB23A TaxID=3156068 RepID=UPI0032AFD740
MKISPPHYILLASLLLSACVSKDTINQQISMGISPEHASHACFDIGNGINSNAITDDYMDALGVEDAFGCIKVLADRHALNYEDRAKYLADILIISSRKSFLPKETLETIATEYKFYKAQFVELKSERETNERIERSNRKQQERITEELVAKGRIIKTVELCGADGFGIGDNEACMMYVMGSPEDINVTITKDLTKKQFVFGTIRNRAYIYTENGLITTIQL